MKRHTRTSGLAALALAPLLLCLTACGGGQENAGQSNSDANASANGSTAAAAGGDPSKLDAEIERLEKLALKNPGDYDSRDALARAYVRRANSLRDAQRLKEALLDYQRALRLNEDDEEAQKNAAEISPLVEGTPQEGEYGEPPPLPITPNVTGGDEKATPTPTPKRP